MPWNSFALRSTLCVHDLSFSFPVMQKKLKNSFATELLQDLKVGNQSEPNILAALENKSRLYYISLIKAA